VTSIVPYLGYERKDQKSQFRDPVTTRYVAAMFEAVGTDRIVTMDVHDLAGYGMPFAAGPITCKATGLFAADFVGSRLARRDGGRRQRHVNLPKRFATARASSVPKLPCVMAQSSMRSAGYVAVLRSCATLAAVGITSLVITPFCPVPRMQAGGQAEAKLHRPAPHRLVGQIDAARSQQFFDHAQA
jgi:hypothetical protein